MSEPRSINAWVNWADQHFTEADLCYGHGTDNAISEAIYLLAYALKTDFDLSAYDPDASLSEVQNQAIKLLMQTRMDKKIPAAYLVNEAWFCGLAFYVDAHVLIPRSPIAELIKAEFQPWIERSELHSLLEIGTGSGCIALSCAHYMPDISVDAVDIDEHAINIARQNCKKMDLQERVSIIQSDVYSALGDNKYDIILSNPPYVSAAEYSHLPDEYKHEPEIGLKSGQDGLDCVRVILAEAVRYLNPTGILIVEVGNSQDILEDAFPEIPFMWLEFEYGGSGVFLLTRAQLSKIFSYYWGT